MRRLSWANRVTLARILLIAPFILLFIDMSGSPARWKRLGLAVLFAGISLTDMLDGFLARRLGQITLLGRMLDPLADKLLTLSAMLLLVTRGVPADAPGIPPLHLPVWVLAVSATR